MAAPRPLRRASSRPAVPMLLPATRKSRSDSRRRPRPTRNCRSCPTAILLPSTCSSWARSWWRTLLGRKWPYSFHVVNQKEINAFALPGGPIYVNLGTIQAADNEAQLAGVMAHEISHIVLRHGTRAATKQMEAQLPLQILGALIGNAGVLAQLTQMGISFGVGSYFLHNSRQAENEADLLGTDIMYDAGIRSQTDGRVLPQAGGARQRGQSSSSAITPIPGIACSPWTMRCPYFHRRTSSKTRRSSSHPSDSRWRGIR